MDQTGYQKKHAGRIGFEVDGTPGVGDMPGRIVFKTQPDGSGDTGTLLTALILDSNQDATLPNGTLTINNYAFPASDGTANQVLQTNGAGNVSWAAAGGGGSGDVVGPASSTDNAVARYDSTTGKLLQNSGVSIDDSNNMTGLASVEVDGDLKAADATGIGLKDDAGTVGVWVEDGGQVAFGHTVPLAYLHATTAAYNIIAFRN